MSAPALSIKTSLRGSYLNVSIGQDSVALVAADQDGFSSTNLTAEEARKLGKYLTASADVIDAVNGHG